MAAWNGRAMEPGPRAFARYGPEDGLPHNTVTDLLEDRFGFIWLATDDGAARFDGYGFETYRTPAASGLSNRIWALGEEDDGTLWAGGSDGLFRVDRARRRLEPEPLRHAGGLPASAIRAVVSDAGGALWVAARAGVFRRAAAGEPFVDVAVEGRAPAADEPPFWAVAVAPDGTVWAKEGAGLSEPIALYRWRADRFVLALRAALGVYHTGLTIDAEGRFWLNGIEPGESGLRVASLPGELGRLAITAGAGDGAGGFWLGSDAGLVRSDRRTGVAERIAYETDPTWHQRWIRTLLRDRAGGLWLGTLAGVYRLDPHRKRFTHLGAGQGADGGLGAAAVGGLLVDRRGDLWIGTMGGGLHRAAAAGGAIERLDSSTPGRRWPCGDDVWSVYEGSSGALWVATDTGLCRSDDGRRFRAVPLGYAGAPVGVFAIVESPPGKLWLTTTASRIGRLDVASGALRWFDGPVSRGFGTWLARGSRELWLGTSVGTVVRVDTVAEELENRPLTPLAAGAGREFMVYDLAEAGDDALWLATEAGLYRHRVADGRSELVLASDSLPGSVVFSLLADSDGVLWLATNAGLARFDPAAVGAGRVRTYDLGDGVGNLEFNRYSRLATPDGELLFGGMTGLTRFRPAEIVDNPYAPPTVLTTIRVLGSDGERTVAPERLAALELPPRSLAVTFELAALDYGRPRRNRFTYRLDGFDPGWIEGGTDRMVRYSRLPPGRYTFRARGRNADGVGGGTEVALPVVVLPAFWQTRWFALLVTAALAGAVAIAWRMRVRRLVELQEMRLRIASDLHDELGSELAAIAFSTSMVERSAELDDAERRRLEKARAGALRVMSGLRDVVWYVNPEHDRLTSLVVRMRSFADAVLPGVEHRVESALAGEEAIDMNVRRQLYLIYKELVTNVAKHAAATAVEIRLEAGRGELRLVVIDDGVGLCDARAGASDGTGLGSVRRRVAAIGAELCLAERVGGGTEATVSVPVAMTRSGHRPRGRARIG